MPVATPETLQPLTLALGVVNALLAILWGLLWWGFRRMVGRQDKTEERLQALAVDTATNHATRDDLEALEARLSQQMQQTLSPAINDLNTIKNLLIAGGLNGNR